MKIYDVKGLIGIIVLTLYGLYLAGSERSQEEFRKANKVKHPFPPVDIVGENPDGSTTIEFANAVPYQLTVTMEGAKKYTGQISACSECKVYPSEFSAPSDICSKAPKDTYLVPPGQHKVLGQWKGTDANNLEATWDLKPGKQYSTCIVLTDSYRESDWNYTDKSQ